jgi:PRC-barrel domain protein
MPTFEEVDAWEGRDAYGPDAEKIGEIVDIYLDQDTGRPEWTTVKTGLLGNGLRFAPLGEARAEGDHIQLSYDKDTIKAAPKVDANDDLSSDEVVELYRYYGVAWHESPADSGRRHDEPAGPGDRDIDRHEPDPTMTRAGGDLHGGTVRHEGGRGRLRRHPLAQVMPAHREEHPGAAEPMVYATRDEEMTRDKEMIRDDRMTRDEPIVGAEAHRR